MVVTVLLLLFGVPTIVGLTLLAVGRARSLSARIAEVQEELARDPRPPYAALAALMQEQDEATTTTQNPRIWPPAPRRGKDE